MAASWPHGTDTTSVRVHNPGDKSGNARSPGWLADRDQPARSNVDVVIRPLDVPRSRASFSSQPDSSARSGYVSRATSTVLPPPKLSHQRILSAMSPAAERQSSAAAGCGSYALERRHAPAVCCSAWFGVPLSLKSNPLQRLMVPTPSGAKESFASIVTSFAPPPLPSSCCLVSPSCPPTADGPAIALPLPHHKPRRRGPTRKPLGERSVFC